MKLEDFLKIFGANKIQKIPEIIEFVSSQQKLLDKRIQQYIIDKCEADENKMTSTDQINVQIIQWNFMMNLFQYLKHNKFNPFMAIMPIQFIDENNNIEKLQDYGNALDKLLYLEWPFFRMFFIKVKQFQYDFKEVIDIMMNCIDDDKLMKICKQSKELLENYATYETLLKNNILYSQIKIQYYISFLAEYLSQIFREEEQVTIIHAMLTKISDRLYKYPQLIFDIVIQSIIKLLYFLDMQSYNIDNISLGVNVPQALISQQYDPMRNRQFRKQDQELMQKKIKQYNNLISNLPAWDILYDMKDLKYFNYTCKRDQLENAIQDLKSMQ